MKRFLRWTLIALGGIVVLALIAVAAIWIRSEMSLRKVWEVPAGGFTTVTDSATIAEGGRLARIRGCWDGCHGVGASGEVFFDEPGVARVIAPDLTKAVRSLSDADLERVIRHGVRADGRSVMIMPANTFRNLDDDELGAIIAFLRAQPPTDGPEYEMTARFFGRLGLVIGQFTPVAQTISKLPPPVRSGVPGTPAYGEHLARSVCTECHGDDLRGAPETPTLALAAAYTPETFRTLLRTGVPPGGRDLGLMKEMAERRFVHFTDAEIDALHAYLKGLAVD